MTAVGLRDRGTPGTPIPDPPGLCWERERCQRRSPDTRMVAAAAAKGLCLDLESNTGDAEADVESSEAGHRSQGADAVPKRRDEPVPIAEDAQEGRAGNGLAIRINPKCIFLNIFPNPSGIASVLTCRPPCQHGTSLFLAHPYINPSLQQ